jgi:hypothetical protein
MLFGGQNFCSLREALPHYINKYYSFDHLPSIMFSCQAVPNQRPTRKPIDNMKIQTAFLSFLLMPWMLSAESEHFPPEQLITTGAFYYPEHWDESQWERDYQADGRPRPGSWFTWANFPGRGWSRGKGSTTSPGWTRLCGTGGEIRAESDSLFHLRYPSGLAVGKTSGNPPGHAKTARAAGSWPPPAGVVLQRLSTANTVSS